MCNKIEFYNVTKLLPTFICTKTVKNEVLDVRDFPIHTYFPKGEEISPDSFAS